MAIHIDEAALNQLRKALEIAGESYKNQYARLTNLIEEITKGDIQGDPANDLLQKYNDKKDKFDAIAKTIDEAEEYMGMKVTGFANLIGDLKAQTR